MNLKGRCALVTGGSRGIGASIATKLASLGATVAITYRSEQQAAAEVVSQIEKAGSHAIAIRADVSDARLAEEVVGKTLSIFGRLDILVCNAGINRDGVVWKMTDEKWDEVVDVNLKGCFNYCRAVAGHMRDAQYGKIVNVTSINGLRGKFGQTNYAASKGGVIALTKTMARELGNKNITVNAVAPGLIKTEMIQNMPEEAQNNAKREIVTGRIGEPEDVADVVAFFCSDLTRHVTGQVLNVDGGQLIA